MVFSSTIFLFVYLPVFLAVYYLLPFRFRSAWILAASWVFYGWWRTDFLFLLAGMTTWTYAAGSYVHRSRVHRPRRSRAALIAGVSLNLAVLGYFKYFNFGVRTLRAVFTALDGPLIDAWSVILPIGISFYTFQATSYLIDVYRADTEPSRRYIDLAAYISLFPQLVAGPIIRYKDIARQLARRRHSFSLFSAGAARFMIGFCKKVLIADTVAGIVTPVFAMGRPLLADAWLGALAYSVQLYFDFSGYSDMAIGLGFMMGFRFPENFNRPYLSRSITEFWQRWHMSLSTWLRDYLYVPLGGNRRGTGRTYVNLMTVMLLGGLWHGAAWTFVLWGAWHGLFLALERMMRGSRVPQRIPRPLATAGTMLVVLIGWVTFRAADFAGATGVYRAMLGLNGTGFSPELLVQFGISAPAALLAGIALLFVEPERGTRMAATRACPSPLTKWAYAAVVPLFLMGVVKMLAASYSPFLYFQF